MNKKLIGLASFLGAFVLGSLFYTTEPSNIAKDVQTVEKKVDVPLPSIAVEPDQELETFDEVNERGSDKLPPLKMKLLEIGEGFHGDEVVGRNGETWLGLFKENGGYFLRPTKLRIIRTHDPIVDGENEKAKTGKDIDVAEKNKPLFLLSNAPKLSEGEVTSVFRGLDSPTYDEVFQKDIELFDAFTRFDKDFSEELELNGQGFSLKVVEGKNKDNEKILALVLERGSIRQVLHTMNSDYSPDLGVLHWIGDLDRDGKPDIYCQLYEHDNVVNRVLFLSSEAEEGKLVKLVSRFWTTGC